MALIQEYRLLKKDTHYGQASEKRQCGCLKGGQLDKGHVLKVSFFKLNDHRSVP